MKSTVIAAWEISARMRLTRAFGPVMPAKSAFMSSVRTSSAVSLVPASPPSAAPVDVVTGR